MTALKTILYFSIFHYPVTREEIYMYSNESNTNDIDNEINDLLNKGIIYKFENFYLKTNSPELIHRRLAGNKMSKEIMPKALKVSKFIGKFPFVENVSLSGALSKGYYDSDGDIDFFIITKPKRLWIARTLLILYKKIFLLNSKKYFCVNYFISSESLKISEQNRFTATELITLIPVYGKEIFESFIRENIWTKNFFPNFIPVELSDIKNIRKPWLSKTIEVLCNTFFGSILDDLLRKITLKKWNSKFKHLDKEDFDIALKSTKNVSKHHPQNFQKKVIDALNEKYTEIHHKHKIALKEEHA